MSEQVFRWYVAIEYRPKMSRPDEVYWEITRDDEMKTVIDAGREMHLECALDDVATSLDDDVRLFRS